MATVTSAGRLLPLSAPLPRPRRFTLLDVADLVTPENDRWMGGAWTEGYPPGPAFTHDPCSSGTDRLKTEAGIIPRQMSGAFTVYLPGQCTAQSIGPDPTFWTDRLRLAFEAVEAQAVERVLVSGDGHQTLGPYLGDTNMEVLAGGAPENPVEALALLEDAVAAGGPSGIIHGSPGIATYWVANTLVTETRGQFYTGIGTPVVVGAGYLDAIPENAGTGQGEWAFASGAIQITRSEVIINPVDYAQALDRTQNDVVFIAERHYLINWVARQDGSDTDHVQAGVLIDRTT